MCLCCFRSCAGPHVGDGCSVCLTPAWVKDIHINRQISNITQLFLKLDAVLSPSEASGKADLAHRYTSRPATRHTLLYLVTCHTPLHVAHRYTPHAPLYHTLHFVALCNVTHCFITHCYVTQAIMSRIVTSHTVITRRNVIHHYVTHCLITHSKITQPYIPAPTDF